ncbi:MAG: bifunctional oligoribonuclease/PAP phosphatase NrnA [Alistipes sp.]|jgi:phosphoesterase RecJ-like protein|nr:bifunctional oligoribonuclease/PAP phosphatase NrnA [Alistipes sp.]
MNIPTQNIELFRALLNGSKRVAILSHTNPDGDALGSSLALAEVLRTKGHTVNCIVPNRYPYYLKWIPDLEQTLVHSLDEEHRCEQIIAEAELIICADMSALSRLEGLSAVIAANTSAKRVLIDHHLSPEEGFDVMFSFPEASSTAFVVYNLLEALYGKEVFTQKIATQLYVGMITDTGNFAFSALTPELFRAVATLCETGIDIPTIYNNVYNSFTEGRARLFGYVINRKMKTLNKGTVAYMSLTEEEMRRFWFQQGDNEGFVNYPLTIKKMRMSAMFTEQHGFIRVSLRSRGEVDVNTFARRYFNGGGHKNAAGGKSFTSMDETIRHYIASVEEYHAEGLV